MNIGVLGKIRDKVPFSSHGIRAHKIYLAYCWCWPSSHGWGCACWVSPCTSPPLFFILYSLEGSHYAWPTLRDWALCPTSLWAEYLHKLSETLLYERFVYSTLLIDCLTDTWLFIFYFWVISNTTLFSCSKHFSFGHWEWFNWFCVSLTYFHHCVFVFLVLPHFLAL